MDTSTTGIQTQKSNRIMSIFQGLARFCTGMFGSSITGQFSLVIKSITLMAMAKTMRFKTSCAFLLKNIIKHTKKKSASEINLNDNLSILTESGIRQQLGTVHLKGWNGTVNTPSSDQKKHTNQYASTVTSKSPTLVAGADLKDLRTTPERSFVRHGVNLPNQASALVKQVRNTNTMQEVFNLEIAEVNCYFANDMLVHNCISQGLRYLRDGGWISIDAAPRDDIEEEDITDAEIFNQRGRVNPYGA
jgi:hypothetical protein